MSGSLISQVGSEIDRVVVGILRQVPPKHGDRIRRVAREAGLESLDLVPDLVEYIAAGALTRSIAHLRNTYRARGEVDARLENLVGDGFLVGTDPWAAAPKLRPLVRSLRKAQGIEADRVLGGHQPLVETILGPVAAIGAGLPLAYSHARLPRAADLALRLLDGLTTLRYVRADAHRLAWMSRGLEAAEIRALSNAWSKAPDAWADAPDGSTVRAVLARRGLLRLDGTLTNAGLELRESIEDETDAQAHTVLAPTASALLTSLRTIPV